VPNTSDATAPSQPTGIIFNGTGDFLIANVPGHAPSPGVFIFATKDGTISAWDPATTPAQLAVNEVTEKGAVFTGLTWIERDGTHFLLASNFSQNGIEEFDTNFKRVALSAMRFDDDQLPPGFAPYNVQAIGDTVVALGRGARSAGLWER
jgi:hypothetical protein